MQGFVRHHARDFLSIAQRVVALGPVAAKVQSFKNADQPSEPVYHLFSFAELFFIVKVGHVDGTIESFVGVGQARHQLVDHVANFPVVLERQHVGKAAAGGYINQHIPIPRVFVRDLFDEQPHQLMVFVLAGVHAAAQFVAGFSQG